MGWGKDNTQLSFSIKIPLRGVAMVTSVKAIKINAVGVKELRNSQKVFHDMLWPDSSIHASL